MGNCLLKKFNVTVNNSNLPLLGVLKIKRIQLEDEGSNNVYARLNIGYSSQSAVKVLPLKIWATNGGKLYSDSARTTELTQPYEINSYNSGVDIYTSNGNYDILLDNKYGVFSNIALQMGYRCPLEDVYYTKISNIEGNGSWYGDVSKLNPELVTRIKCGTTPSVTGTIDDIVKLTKLIQVQIQNEEGNLWKLGALTNLKGESKVTVRGSIESFVAVQRGHGRTVCESADAIDFLWLSGMSKIVTFNGVAIDNTNHNEITWTADTITLAQTGKSPVTINNSDSYLEP